MGKQSAEAAAVERAEMGVSEHPMSGAWRVIIARTPQRYVAYYFHENDDPRLKRSLLAQAHRWYEAQIASAAA